MLQDGQFCNLLIFPHATVGCRKINIECFFASRHVSRETMGPLRPALDGGDYLEAFSAGLAISFA